MFLKKLKEQRNALKAEMDAMLKTAEEEERALTEEEDSEFTKKESEIKKIDRTIEAYEKRAQEEQKPEEKEEDGDKEKESAEERAFAEFIRGTYSEERADANLDFTTNGAIVPASIANRIISRVKDISPILQLAETFTLGGTLTVPVYDEETQKITMAYADEFTELESTSGKFKAVTLSGFLAGALTKVSKSLINNTNFDIVSYVVEKVAEAIVEWFDKEMLHGTEGKITALSEVSQVVTAASSVAITADELIDVQEEVPDRYQPNCIWVMNRTTRKAIRKLKDQDGNYLLNKDVTAKWGYTLLGADVYCSDEMDEIAAEKTVVYYGDFSGLTVKFSETPSIEVLREKFATQHAVGVVAWVEADAKLTDKQKVSALKMGA